MKNQITRRAGLKTRNFSNRFNREVGKSHLTEERLTLALLSYTNVMQPSLSLTLVIFLNDDEGKKKR